MTVLIICLLSATVWQSNASAESSATATGASSAMNPAISLNGLFAAGWADYRQKGEQETSISLQEMELAAMSVVDPYFKAYLKHYPVQNGDLTIKELVN